MYKDYNDSTSEMYMRNRWNSILTHLVDPSFHTRQIELPDRHSTPKGCSKSKGAQSIVGLMSVRMSKDPGVDERSWLGKNQRMSDDELEYGWGSRGYEP